MATSYPYTKANVNPDSLEATIQASTIIVTLLLGSSHEEPDDLTIVFDTDLSGTEETELDSIVAAHAGLPLSAYQVWCYTESTRYRVLAESFPSECPNCSSGNIENVTDKQEAYEGKTYWIEISADIVQHIVKAWGTQTNDLFQCQSDSGDPVMRIAPNGSVIIPVTNTMKDGQQILLANTQTPGASDTLVGLKIDYTGVSLTNNPGLQGVDVNMPATYGTGEEWAGRFNGDGKTIVIASDWEGLYVTDGTTIVRLCDWESALRADGKVIIDVDNDNALIVRKDGAAGDVLKVDTNNGVVIISGDLKVKIHTNDVSNPPTDAELDGLFGTPATVGAGFTAYIDDNGAGNNFYQVTSDGTNWWLLTATKAT